MANENLSPEQVQAAAEEAKIKVYLKEKYGIEDDPDTFKTKMARAREAEAALPRYHATLEALVQAAEEAEQNAPKQAVSNAQDPDDEARQDARIFQADPYEGTKRVLGRRDAAIEERIESAKEEAANEAERRIIARDMAREASGQVRNQWPEAFDRSSKLHLLGKHIFQNEMSDTEKRHPRSFLIATERAAGRLGLAPRHLRADNNPREDAEEQNVSRQSRRPRSTDADDGKLTAKQQKIAAIMDLDPKQYAKVAKARREGRNLDE